MLLVALVVQRSRQTTVAPAAAPPATPTATATATAVPPTAAPTIVASVRTKVPVPDTCPITRPPNPPFVPPPPGPAQAPYGEFWYGTADLWTPLRPDGTWRGLPHDPEGYTQKIFLWPGGELRPKITIMGKRLDDSAASLYSTTGGTNASHPDFGPGMVMLWGVDLPSLGCWQLTVEHAGINSASLCGSRSKG